MTNSSNERYTAPSVQIIDCNPNGITVCASSARISTTQGTALELFDRSLEKANNLSLLQKVLSSGHKSVLEHCCFNLAFNNVSIFAEQFIIEFRLASYTVKSRRYVDFGEMGYYLDQTAPQPLQELIRSHADGQFARYTALLELGIPKEDARFVLPYCAYSNFFCTCNARELLHMAASMRWGRGRVYPEIAALGEQLARQLEAYLPGVLDGERASHEREEAPKTCPQRETPQPVRFSVALLEHTDHAGALLRAAYALTGTDPENRTTAVRPRELELLRYTYRIDDISLAAVTHLVRHRMQSVLVPPVFHAPLRNRYILPDSIAADPVAAAQYHDAFAASGVAAAQARSLGASDEGLVYFALSGHTLDLLTAMNGRELRHFCLLRTCTRAQWEIRRIALAMLKQARAVTPEAVSGFGPACYMLGGCTEGRMCCGRAEETARLIDSL